MPLGLGTGLSKSGIVTPGIVTDNLVLKHNYDAGAVVPVSNGAAYFDGTDDYITMGDITSFDGADDLTICCWVIRLDDDSFYPVDKGGYWLTDASFGLNYSPGTSSGRLHFSVGESGAGAYRHWSSLNDNVFPKNKWTHIAVVYSNTSNTIKGYINGVDLGVGGGAGTHISIPNKAKNLVFGRRDAAADWLNGYMCNVGMWTSSLTQAQIKSIMWKNYAGLTDSEKTNLVSWWNLDSTATNTVGNFVSDNHYGGNSNELGSEVYTTNNALATVDYESALPATTLSSGTLNGLTATGLQLGYNIGTYKIGSYSLKLISVNSQNDRFSTSFSTTSGKSYEISFYMKFGSGIYTTAGTGAQETFLFKVGTSDNDTTNANVALLDIHTLTETTTDWYNYKIRFTASASTSHFTFIKTDAIGLGSSADGIYIDDFSVKEFQGNPGELK